MGSGLTAAVAAALGVLAPVAALFFAAGAVLALVIAASGSKPVEDTLYPARLCLARFRRDEKPADVLVASFPTAGSLSRRTAGRRTAKAAGAVLRVTDGVCLVPALHGQAVCAVLEPDPRTRAAIEQRLTSFYGEDVRVGWASCPDDAVTLDSLVAVAVDRGSTHSRTPQPVFPQRLRAEQVLASTLSPNHPSARRTR